MTKITTMSRRTLLTALPASGAALALPNLTGAATLADTPVMALFREWRRLHEAGFGPMTEEEADEVSDRMSLLAKRMMAVPSDSAADLAAKVIALTGFGTFDLSDGFASDFWVELRQLTAI